MGPTEIIIVLALALLVLGPQRLPAAGRSLGRGMREFKESLTGGPGGPGGAEQLHATDTKADDGHPAPRSGA